jgi:hypothetical protein
MATYLILIDSLIDKIPRIQRQCFFAGTVIEASGMRDSKVSLQNADFHNHEGNRSCEGRENVRRLPVHQVPICEGFFDESRDCCVVGGGDRNVGARRLRNIICRSYLYVSMVMVWIQELCPNTSRLKMKIIQVSGVSSRSVEVETCAEFGFNVYISILPRSRSCINAMLYVLKKMKRLIINASQHIKKFNLNLRSEALVAGIR